MMSKTGQHIEHTRASRMLAVANAKRIAALRYRPDVPRGVQHIWVLTGYSWGTHVVPTYPGAYSIFTVGHACESAGLWPLAVGDRWKPSVVPLLSSSQAPFPPATHIFADSPRQSGVHGV
jgi:hypothetical protein